MAFPFTNVFPSHYKLCIMFNNSTTLPVDWLLHREQCFLILYQNSLLPITTPKHITKMAGLTWASGMTVGCGGWLCCLCCFNFFPSSCFCLLSGRLSSQVWCILGAVVLIAILGSCILSIVKNSPPVDGKNQTSMTSIRVNPNSSFCFTKVY